MDKRIAYALIVIGVVGGLFSLLYDAFHGGANTFGGYQIAGVVAGIVLVAAGVYLGFVRKPAAPGGTGG